ncbi:MAG: ComEC family competence protein [Bacteroidaceae bacterium]|nr:ComEC family competence protein [Bacteroidaceae bacterium]
MRLSDWPSLRLVIPLIAGILISDTIGNTRTVMTVWSALLSGAVVLTFLSFLYGGRAARLFGVGLSLSFLCIGAILYSVQSERVKVEWCEQDATHKGMLMDYPLERARSYRLDLILEDSAFCGKKIYLYVPKDSVVTALEPGESVLFYGRIEKPSNEGTPDFDYASYLYRHGISGTLWVRQSNWRKSGVTGKVPLHVRAVKLRRRMYEKYSEWGLEGDPLAVVSAVTLGSKRDLGQGLKEVYSTSGASHVLAVSGLHVGIMCAFLFFLLPAGLTGRSRWLRECIVMVVMWAYAFAIGLPLSITRSLIMFTMLAFCRVIHRDSSSVNTLAFAALAILSANPAGLFDIGFQLSFLAVFFILIMEPSITEFVHPRTLLGKYIWGIISVSIAAQIGTAPVVMYSFSGFSTYFLLTNLIVIPLMFLTVCLSMTLWIIGWVPLLRVCVVKVLTLLVNTINGGLQRIVELPHSRLMVSIDNPFTVWVIYAVIILLFLWLQEKRSHRLVEALACIAIGTVVATIENFAV